MEFDNTVLSGFTLRDHWYQPVVRESFSSGVSTVSCLQFLCKRKCLQMYVVPTVIHGSTADFKNKVIDTEIHLKQSKHYWVSAKRDSVPTEEDQEVESSSQYYS